MPLKTIAVPLLLVGSLAAVSAPADAAGFAHVGPHGVTTGHWGHGYYGHGYGHGYYGHYGWGAGAVAAGTIAGVAVGAAAAARPRYYAYPPAIYAPPVAYVPGGYYAYP